MNKSYRNLFEIIKSGATKKQNLFEIYNFQKNINDELINNFFENLMNEVDLSRYNKFNSYLKYINILDDKFKNCFEFSGGKKYRYFHSQNVAFLANQIADDMNINDYDRNIIILSSLFHDIGKSIDCFSNIGSNGFCGVEQELKINHEEISANMVKDILKNDFNTEIIEKIAYAINNELCDTLYAKVLFDADNMAELGEIGIFRMFYYTTCDGQSIDQMISFWESYDRIDKKTSKLNKTKLDISKKYIAERLNFMNNFILSFKNENEIL